MSAKPQKTLVKCYAGKSLLPDKTTYDTWKDGIMCNKTFYFLQFYAFIRENLREYKLNLCYGSMREVRVFHEQYKVSKKGSVL